MATIKSYTDLEQSKKLAKILPLKSADCFWDYDDLQKYHRINWFDNGYDKDSQLRLNKNNVYAWTLAALLGVLPNGIVMNKDSQTGRYHFSSIHAGTYVTTDNPVDACVAMIEKLHELNLL